VLQQFAMNLFEKDDNGHKLFAALEKADSSTLIGHSIKSIINSCESKDDFDWLVTQLKDYAADTKDTFITVVGKEASD
jgi:hypothetical protein